MTEQKACGQKCEIFSRVVGYFRPVNQWNKGKQEEFKDKKLFQQKSCEDSKFGKLGKPTASAQKITNY